MTMYVIFNFKWPSTVTAENYSSNEDVELQVNYETGVPIPNVGEVVIIDHPDDGESYDQMKRYEGSYRAPRFLEGEVTGRKWAYTTSRHERNVESHIEITITLGAVTYWPNTSVR